MFLIFTTQSPTMKKLHVNFMKDLRNHEFVEAYSVIINYIEKQRIDDANIKIAFEKVKSNKMRLLNMQKRKRSSFSIENKELTRMRNDYLISLRLRVKSFLLSPIAAERNAANIIHFVIEPYGKKYYVATILSQTRLVDDLEDNMKQSKDFRNAISLLQLNDLMNTIIEMTDEIMINYNLRLNESGEAKSKREGVKEAAYRDMKIMADAINFVAVINQHNEEKMVVIEELIYFIDGILKDFRTKMKSRNTKRKNKRDVRTAVMRLVSMQREQRKLLTVGERSGDLSTGSRTALLTDSETVHSAGSGTALLAGSETALSSDLLTVVSIDSESVHLIGESTLAADRH